MTTCTMLLFLIFSGLVISPCNSKQVGTNHTYGLIRNILEILKWKEIIVVYDDDDVGGRLNSVFINDLLTMLDDHDVRRTVYKMQFSYLNGYLHEIHNKHFPKIQIVYVTTDNPQIVSRVMKTVNNFDFNSNRRTDFRVKSKWLLLTYPVVTRALVDILTDLCHVTVIHQYSDGCFEVNALVKKVNRSSWTSIPKLSKAEDVFPNVRFHFNGRKIVFGALAYNLLQKRVINGTSVFGGWMFELLEDMAADLNFSYEIQEPNDGIWGVRIAGNDTWTGLIGQAQRREIDVVYAEYMVTADRGQVMDFILPALDTTSMVVIYRNIGEEDNWAALLKPLNANIYIAIFVSYAMLSCLLIASEISLDMALEQNGEYRKSWQIPFYLLGCLFLEGSHIQPRTRKGRILYASWWMFCVTIAAVYTANLTSSLLIRKAKIPFKSLEELAEKENWNYGLLKDSGIQDIFEKATIGVNKKIWTGIVKQNKTNPSLLSDNLDYLLDRVLDGKFALIHVGALDHTISRNDCLLSVVDHILMSQYISFAVPLNSPLKDDLSRYMFRRFDAGLIASYQNKLKETPFCTNIRQTDKVQGFSMNNIKGSFGILGIGLLASLVSLLLEYPCKVMQHKADVERH